MIDPPAHLFQPNNLSSPRPTYLDQVEPGLENTVDEVLKIYYADEIGTSFSVSQLESPHSLSTNFVVRTASHRLFLKSRPVGDGVPNLGREVTLLALLQNRKLSVPRVVPNKNALGLTSHADREWVLQNFIDGSYFSGNQPEFASCAIAFAELTQSLVVVQPYLNQMHACWGGARFLDHLEELLKLSESRTADLLPVIGPSVSKALQIAKQEQQTLHTIVAPVHIDFHPHNLLTDGTHLLAILDFEDVIIAPLLVACGFNAYKLLRQSCTDKARLSKELTSHQLRDDWISAWNPLHPTAVTGPQLLTAGARYRVLWLIYFILERALVHGDSQHIYELEKHLFALEEIEILFG